MKTFRQFIATAVLTLVLTFPAFAGEIQSPGVANPPPPPSQQSSVTGDMSCPGVASTGEIPGPGVVALDPVIGTALSLLQSVLSIF
jgi:hypothetical protein